MLVYIVTKEGVYRHEIWGVYTTEEAARARCIEALRAESDDYHEAHVISATVGEPICEETLICAYQRKDVYKGGRRYYSDKTGYHQAEVESSQITERTL